MLNLFDYLTPLDNKRIENYITTMGIAKESYIGNKTYLRYWAKCNKRLFHLLGGNLIYKFDANVELEEGQLLDSTKRLLDNSSLLDALDVECKKLGYDAAVLRTKLYSPSVYINNRIGITCKLPKNEKGKSLTIDPNMKPMKVISKLINYFDYGVSDLIREDFEAFRLAHSMILNEKNIKGKFCISIHPLDFMTMSDNSSDWSSCMRWGHDGCYRLGTVEMMNSNNVVCCYIESASTPFYFHKNENEKGEEYTWNNKKWRQLCYVTNEIIMGGKAYPYQNKAITEVFLNKLRELAKENLGKTYSFGLEEYQDMKYIGSEYRMNVNKEWIQYGNTRKHNIIFDTKAMYNDMFNDHDGKTKYWCFRNKVKKNTIISCSGKAVCLKCGKIIEESNKSDYDIYDGSYNERYVGSRLLCEDCIHGATCQSCWSEDPLIPHYELSDGNILCETCVTDRYRKCPICGDFYNIQNVSSYYEHFYISTKKGVKYSAQDSYNGYECRFYLDDSSFTPKEGLIELEVCPDCLMDFLDNKFFKFTKLEPDPDVKPVHYYHIFDNRYIATPIYDDDMPAEDREYVERFFRENFMKPDIKSLRKI